MAHDHPIMATTHGHAITAMRTITATAMRMARPTRSAC